MIDEKTKKKIFKEYSKGVSAIKLAKKYKVSRSAIYNYIEAYRPVPTKIVNISRRELYLLKKENQTLKQMIEIFERTQCVKSTPLSLKLEAMKKVEKEFSHSTLCRTLDVKKGTFLNHLYRKVEVTQLEADDDVLKRYILELFNLHGGRIGALKIRELLKMQGIVCSQRRTKRLMNELELKVRRSDRAKEKIVHRHPNKSTLPNILKRQFYPAHPNKVWVSDFTQFNTDYINKYYICVILDLFSRKVVSYNISAVCDTEFLITVLDEAISNRNPDETLLFHSDQGTQFTSKQFRNKLMKMNITQSFSAPGVPYDNAVIEGFFSSLKREALYFDSPDNIEDLSKSLDTYITYYNTLRPHKTLNFLSPDQYEEAYYSKKLD